MLHRNVENFIGCDSSYRTAGIVLYGAPFDSTTSYRPAHALALPPSATKAMAWKPTAPIRIKT
mgnify:CR=1 FL=1